MNKADTKNNLSKSGFDWNRFDDKKFFSETNRVAKYFKPATENE